MAGLKASVIIPAYNASKVLPRCLDALQNQSFPGKFDVIVVDDGSKDNTAEIAKGFKGVRVFSQQNAGPAVARNAGAKQAQGEIVVFTDADCVPSKNWLKKMVAPFSDPMVVGVQGAYKTRQKEIIARFTQVEVEYRYKRLKNSKKIDWIGSYSAAYRRDIFLEETGFLSSFPTASGEDPELSYRLAEKKYKLVFKEDATIYHFHPVSLFDLMKKKFTHAKWRLLLYSLHPEKTVRDSYTPQGLKFEILAVFGTIFALLLSLVWQDMLFFAMAGFIFLLLLMVPFVFFALKRDFLIGVLSPAILLLRDVAFAFGLLSGAFKRVWNSNN